MAAAGGLVWRIQSGEVEVALVHRPRYDDWTLPKGKLATGESELAAAVREVGEELGASVAVSWRIGRVSYDVDGARKSVAYWLMRYLGGEFSPGDEVDAIAWLPPRHARERLSYRGDRTVLADFAASPLPDSVVVLVRHAKAGKRSSWPGADALRPLDAVGEQQARRLAGLLALFAPDRIVAADRTRCVQTVEPLADALQLPVLVEPAFDDEGYLAAPTTTQTALLTLAKPGRVSVVCSQGVAIPALVERLAHGVRSSETRKSAAWVLSFVDGDVIAADYYEDAAREAPKPSRRVTDLHDQ